MDGGDYNVKCTAIKSRVINNNFIYFSQMDKRILKLKNQTEARTRGDRSPRLEEVFEIFEK